MILSQTATYAVRAALYLSESGEHRVPVGDIADALGVPRNYLSKILQSLSREGVLHSTRGPRGGFALARSPDRIRLSEVVDPFDDITRASGCLLGEKVCSDDDPCPAHSKWREVAGAIRTFLNTTTLEELSRSPAGVDLL